MADEVKVQEVKTEEVKASAEAAETVTETKPKRGRKKGSTTKSSTVKKTESKSTSDKKPGRKAGVKTTARKSSEKTEKSIAKKASQVPELNCKSLTIEFNDKKYTEKDLYDRVKAYISSHPYIVAHDIELFIKPNESCAYFTIDGFSNPDFRIDL